MERAEEPSVHGPRTAIFSKCPRPGEVKTRLSPPLSPAQAARLAEAMLRDAVERLSASSAFETRLAFAPSDAEPWFRAAFPTLTLEPQRGPGLGERLAEFFSRALAPGGAPSCVVIGSDQPLLSTALIDSAHQRLAAGADLVLGPDHGGGYYLVGLRRAQPKLFNVEMSSAGMLAATVELARARGLTVELLEPCLDVDVYEDLLRLRAELGQRRSEAPGPAAEFPRRTASVLDEILRQDP